MVSCIGKKKNITARGVKDQPFPQNKTRSVFKKEMPLDVFLYWKISLKSKNIYENPLILNSTSTLYLYTYNALVFPLKKFCSKTLFFLGKYTLNIYIKVYPNYA